ncbi:class I SAM-dependent methyltransferase [Allonocardiopsis opalescens]|uniref:Methyltransferase family protein n=1 Tax=Allonocardiopsis opalescens TaxID=1144618 RepID=A0A2T0QDQ8_9ACTN|nr:methyltransferase domain-containing protein [Allonocardiopsis opalescens]PRY02045.1 methyltransferase family protein [Allonocardiopsis opalescens]
MRPSPASHFAASDSPSAYWRFYWAVASAQLNRWLPRPPGRLLDLSGVNSASTRHAVLAGHDVVAVVDPRKPADLPALDSRLHPVIGDGTFLSFFTDGSFDAVIADSQVLSRQLVTEALMGEIARVLRPGGRALLCVDSVVLGMALLAEQDRWRELANAAAAEVLLVPWPDGTITRCFTGDQLRELVSDTGLELEWMKPRTVLSASTVELVLSSNERALPRLVQAELEAADSAEFSGMHLVASARKP